MVEKKESKKEPKEEKEDTKRELKDTQQEIMFDLKLKTDSFLEKLKEQQRKNKVSFGGM